MLKRILFGLAALGALLALALWALPHWPLPRTQTPISLSIPQGAGLARVAAEIERAGLAPAWVVRLVVRLRGSATRLMAGEYQVGEERTLGELIEAIESGRARLLSLTLIEGMNLRDLQALLKRASEPPIKLQIQGLESPESLKRLITGEYASAEGWFFPDTYHLAPETRAETLLRQMHERMQRELETVWRERVPDLPLANPYEALILASIIEKETGRDADRPLIASVFVNRLKAGMRLQTDPTVIYGLGEAFDGNLTRRHLQTDTAYNTYTRSGLPPTPIAMPGRASLRAAVAPAETDYYYFVARGDGSSVFSRNLAEHNRAVARYQLGR